MVGANAALVSRWLSESAPVVPGPYYCRRIAEVLGLPKAHIMQLAGHDEPTPAEPSGIDMEKQQALLAFERILDERPRSRWRGIVAITRGVAEALEDEVPPDPSTHHGNDDGRDNVNRHNLVGVLVA